MRSRDLKQTEWQAFFDSFSRRFHDKPMSLAVRKRPEGLHFLAQHLPLTGVTVQKEKGVDAVELELGDEKTGHVSHIVRCPMRVRVGQVSNGSDEVLLIRGEDGATTLLDFSKVGVIHRVVGKDRVADG
jgi:hypothetical protein